MMYLYSIMDSALDPKTRLSLFCHFGYVPFDVIFGAFLGCIKYVKIYHKLTSHDPSWELPPIIWAL